MLFQIDKHNAIIAGTIVQDPTEGKDKKGNRMVRLIVAYGYVREGNGFVRLELPVIVSGYYTSYARLAVKGDCLLAVGKKEILPDGQKENTLFVSRYQCAYINIVGTMRTFREEEGLAEANAANAELKKKRGRPKKQKPEKDLDEFTEIRGDWY